MNLCTVLTDEIEIKTKLTFSQWMMNQEVQGRPLIHSIDNMGHHNFIMMHRRNIGHMIKWVNRSMHYINEMMGAPQEAN